MSKLKDTIMINNILKIQTHEGVVTTSTETYSDTFVLSRDIHTALKHSGHHSVWLNRCNEQLEAMGDEVITAVGTTMLSNIDIVLTPPINAVRGKYSIWTADQAKHVAMITNTSMSYAVRQYFIEVERLVKMRELNEIAVNVDNGWCEHILDGTLCHNVTIPGGLSKLREIFAKQALNFTTADAHKYGIIGNDRHLLEYSKDYDLPILQNGGLPAYHADAWLALYGVNLAHELADACWFLDKDKDAI